jgi:hypothetical protein
MESLGVKLKKPFEINEDNQSVMKMIDSGKIDKKT